MALLRWLRNVLLSRPMLIAVIPELSFVLPGMGTWPEHVVPLCLFTLDCGILGYSLCRIRILLVFGLPWQTPISSFSRLWLWLPSLRVGKYTFPRCSR